MEARRNPKMNRENDRYPIGKKIDLCRSEMVEDEIDRKWKRREERFGDKRERGGRTG